MIKIYLNTNPLIPKRYSLCAMRLANFPWRPLPCGVGSHSRALASTVGSTPRGESSSIRLPKRKFNRKFQISWLVFATVEFAQQHLGCTLTAVDTIRNPNPPVSIPRKCEFLMSG